MALKRERGKEKQRNTGKRERKRIILFATEGSNKTETNYLRRFQSDAVQIRFTAGNETDPVKMMQRLVEEFRGISPEPGDRAYCMVDADVNPSKNAQIAAADKLAKGMAVRQIVSNPCFELWFLNHYRYTTKQFHSSLEVIAALTDEYPPYTKNGTEMYDRTVAQISVAIDRSRKQEQYCAGAGYKPHTSDFQPSTEVYLVIEDIYSGAK